MNKEDLKKLGIEDEDISQKIIVLHGKDIEKHKSASDTAKIKIGSLARQLDEANETIKGFKEMDIEGIQKASDDWKVKAEKAKEDSEKEVAQIKFDHALSLALTDAKAKNPTAVKSLLKTSDLKLAEDGSIVGLSEQLEKIQEDDAYLFEMNEEDPSSPPQIVTKTKNKSVLSDKVVRAAREGAGLSTEE